MLAVAFCLTCLAFGQTTGEQAIRIADLERRVQPVDGLTVSVAELKTEVHAINEKVDTQTTQSRELLFGFVLLLATKLMDAFGFTIRRGNRRDETDD